jgi:sialic acid synthase SpsE
MKIGKHKIGKNYPTYIVAEAGINHNGNVETAKNLITEASKCGANAIKIQTIIPGDLFSESTNPKLYQMCKNWVLSKQEHLILKDFAKKNNIDFFSTPVGNKSLSIIKQIKLPAIKIASGDLNNLELIREAANIKCPIIISTGMSTITEISQAVELLRQIKTEFALLHCVSSYPAPIEEANLRTIPYLISAFDVPVGYSDHTLGIESSLAAVALGAVIIEKHFTLDKQMEGPDQNLSADPAEFKMLVQKIRIIEKTLGKHRSGVLTSEAKFRNNMRRSIAVNKTLQKGRKITKSDLTLIRPGTGIPPSMIEQVVGLKLKQEVKKGNILSWKVF